MRSRPAPAPAPAPAAPLPWLALFALLFDFAIANHGKTFYVHWNTTNSIFRIDNTDHVFDLNKGNSQFDYDQVNIVCPVYAPDAYDESQERYIIYNVSKEEYDTCRITNPNPRIIAICDKPQKLMFFTITFRPFSPQPGGLEFFPGKDYYFISTSSRDDLHRRIGGWCSSHNMKLVFRVCCRAEEPPPPPPTTGAPPPPPPPPRATAATIAPPSAGTTTTRRPKKNYKHDGDKSPNEVVKSEELSSSCGHPATLIVALVVPALVAALTR